MRKLTRSTPAGEHRAVLLDEVMAALDPKPGEIVVDCTIGWAGHAVELLKRVGPSGLLIGLDLDAENLPKARERLETVGGDSHLHHANFAGLPQIFSQHGILHVDAILADLGMSSMQVDDPARGFSYRRDGALDMRMDRSRGRTAAELLARMPQAELAEALRTLGDEPDAERIAAAIERARESEPIVTTQQLARIIQAATQTASWRLHPTSGKWNLHPAARTFQALRLLVNRELPNLQQLLRVAPDLLLPAGRIAIISFHSGEDSIVKSAFRKCLAEGHFSRAVDDPVRASFAERQANPRSRSAKLRWARR